MFHANRTQEFRASDEVTLCQKLPDSERSQALEISPTTSHAPHKATPSHGAESSANSTEVFSNNFAR